MKEPSFQKSASLIQRKIQVVRLTVFPRMVLSYLLFQLKILALVILSFGAAAAQRRRCTRLVLMMKKNKMGECLVKCSGSPERLPSVAPTNLESPPQVLHLPLETSDLGLGLQLARSRGVGVGLHSLIVVLTHVGWVPGVFSERWLLEVEDEKRWAT